MYPPAANPRKISPKTLIAYGKRFPHHIIRVKRKTITYEISSHRNIEFYQTVCKNVCQSARLRVKHHDTQLTPKGPDNFQVPSLFPIWPGDSASTLCLKLLDI